jgi:AraC-like DNA-binding protein
MDFTRSMEGRDPRNMEEISEWGDRADSAVLVYANHYQFGPGEDYLTRTVASRTMLWGISGTGEVRSGSFGTVLDPGTVVIFPWRSDIHYLADASDPFLTGCAHLLPWHAPAVPIIPVAGHGADDPLTSSPHRRDVDWPGFSRPRVVTGTSAARLIRIGEVAVDWRMLNQPDEAGMRALGLVLARAIAALRPEPDAVESVPASFAAMQEYARDRIPVRVTTEQLAAVGACSVSTAERQFRSYTGRSPQGWIRDECLALAAYLLRTTNRPVIDIAPAAGFDDPLYFSRVFRTRYGVPPSRYARRSPPL